MTGLVRLEYAQSVAVISLARAERHNSLVPDLLAELQQTVEAVAADDGIGAIVLRGDGPSFSTGGDLQGFLDHWDADIAAYADEMVGALNAAILALRAAPVPVVGAVHGWVTGGALGLVLGSDIVLLEPGARLAPFYCEVGFAPDGGWSSLLPGLIGERRCVHALLTNEVWSAQEMVALGIANRVIEHGALDAAALEAAWLVSGKAGTSLSAVKANRRALDDWREPLEVERRQFVETIQLPGVRQGVERFLDRGEGAQTGEEAKPWT